MKIAIIGNGFVGDAVHQGMKDHYEVLVYDVDPQKSLNDLSEINEVKNIFLCVPTPMALEGGIDISIIKDVVFALEPNKNIVVKSTITPQAAKEIIDLYPNQNFIFNPEFLTERTAVEDFKNPSRIVLGGDKEPVEDIKKIYKKVFPTVKYITTDYKTACFIKYFCNCFYAMKISIMNEFRQLADVEGVDWQKAMCGLISSGWVNSMHTMVPGTDGKLGFGGKCFPKDLNAFIDYGLDMGIDTIMMEAAWVKNLQVRKKE